MFSYPIQSCNIYDVIYIGRQRNLGVWSWNRH